ncbi:MAG: hypothetical protein QW833_02880, partial [Candidatus Anstonellaceae archaeon]
MVFMSFLCYKKILFLVGLVGFVILLSGCISAPCEKDAQCQNWEYCDQSKKTCVVKEGMCNYDEDCKDPSRYC